MMERAACAWRWIVLAICWTVWPPHHAARPVLGQSFAELGSVRFGGADGAAGSILPYSSTSQAAGGRGSRVDPDILNVNSRTTSPPEDGPIYVGPKYVGPNSWPARNRQSGPIFHPFFLPSRPTRPARPPGTASGSVWTWPGGGSSFHTDWGGGRLLDPPNRSSIWRTGHVGASVNLQDNHLNCGAQHTPMTSDAEERKQCGVCGDSPLGLQNHMIGGRYVKFPPYVSRAYRVGALIPVSFVLNHTIIPGLDRVSFSLCRVNSPWRDVTWDCLQEGEPIRIVGWGREYIPARSGFHRVYLRLPPRLICHRCVLQWRWTSSQSLSRRQCDSRPWLRACYRPVEYINCADISVTHLPFLAAFARYSLMPEVSS